MRTLLQDMTSYRIELPEVFTGEDGKDFHQWIRRFEVAAEAFSDSSTKLHSLLPARLAGSAFTVWESLTESEKKDFEKVKEKLSQVFGRTQLIDTFKSCITARTRRPGEPLEVFGAAIASMVEEAFPNYDGPAKAGEKFRRYIAGLDRNLQVKIHEMGGANFEEALKIALRVERAGQTHQDMGIQVATMDTTKGTTTQPSEMQLVLHRLNELEQKFEKMCSKLEASATSNVHPRPSTRSPQRHNSPEPRSDDRYQRRNRSPSPAYRAYQSTESNYRHRSPSPHIRDYPPRSPDHRRQYRSPSPQYYHDTDLLVHDGAIRDMCWNHDHPTIKPLQGLHLTGSHTNLATTEHPDKISHLIHPGQVIKLILADMLPIVMYASKTSIRKLLVVDEGGHSSTTPTEAQNKINVDSISPMKSPYIPIVIDNVYALAFLDTGAHISLLSADFLSSIPTSQRSPLEKSTIMASSVTGEPVDNIGTVVASIHLGNKATQHKFFVARNITHPVILGWDFITQQNASISSASFNMPGATIPFVDRQQYQAPLKCKVSLVGHAHISPMCETHVQGRLSSPQFDIIPRDYDGYFEPTTQDQVPVIGARSLFKPQDGLILIRLINPSNEAVNLPAETCLGQFFSVTGNSEEEFEIVSVTANTKTQPMDKSLTASLLPSSELSKEEYEKAEQLLFFFFFFFFFPHMGWKPFQHVQQS